MKMTSKTIVFFGSGPVAAKSLELLTKDFEVEAAITKPSTTKEMQRVIRADTPVYSVSNKTELDSLLGTSHFSSQLGVLIDFGIIVSQKAIDTFPMGIINSHFSLLPEWRGADPISFAILSGQPKTGVSLMIIDVGMDTGKLITQKAHHIAPNATTPSLTKELVVLSHNLLVENLSKYIDGELKPRRQSHPYRATYSRKLNKADGIINWSKTAEEIDRQIRAFIEWPQSSTKIGDNRVIITEGSPIDESGSIGTYRVEKNKLIFYCKDSGLEVIRLKPEGKSEMSIEAFLAGYKDRL